MKPLIVLLSTFAVVLAFLRIFQGGFNWILAARVALSVMLCFTALGHFMFTEGMTMMVPDIIPFKKGMVYLTGIIEITAAIGIHVPQVRVITGVLLVIFFVTILPANIKAVVEHIDYQKGTYDGSGLTYLWFRIPFQILLLAWVYLSVIRK